MSDASVRDCVTGHHSAVHVVGDVAVKQPGPNIIWAHIDDLSGSGKYIHRINA